MTVYLNGKNVFVNGSDAVADYFKDIFSLVKKLTGVTCEENIVSEFHINACVRHFNGYLILKSRTFNGFVQIHIKFIEINFVGILFLFLIYING